MKKLFPAESRSMLVVYREWLQGDLRQNVDESRVSELMEADVMFGKRIFAGGFSDFLEIGCGLALPALTLKCLGGGYVWAFDLNLRIVGFAQRMSRAAGQKIRLECRDFRYSRFPSAENTIWFANKPWGADGGDSLLWEILARAVKKRVSLALVPRIGPEESHGDYKCRCRRVTDRLVMSGYSTDSGKLHPRMPLNWILARPPENKE